ncbi:MAG: pallilysin-related adhesin [Treponema sp.]|jgi:hypothetical protein|nr:pallilysin-related adhesin [Treponema sp.]
MNNKRFPVLVIFLFCAAGIAVFSFWPFSEQKPQEQRRTRIIVPSTADYADTDSPLSEYAIQEDGYSLKAPLDDGEFAITELTIDFDNDSIEEQIVVYRSLTDTENPVSLTLIDYDERSRTYRRLWNIPVAATMPGTVSLYTQDLLGDRSFCVIITGMNMQGEHTMTVFRENQQGDKNQPFIIIAGIQGGSITVQETERPPAYQQGIARGQPFVITTYGRDSESDNMMDRIEISYAFNPLKKIYEQSAITRVPGSQIEQRRLREILTGEPKIFEDFIYDLWYYISPEGTIDKSQYLYFDPVKREIIFFGDDIQQVFAWQNSNATRYGIYVSSQNISVTTLRRFLDIEMESLDSIRMRVFEDVKLKINLNASWDGLYRRAGDATRAPSQEKTVRPYIDAVYDSSLGRLRFRTSGEYELSSSGSVTKGRYAFFRINNQELLELRPEHNGVHNGAKKDNGENRLIYKLSSMEKSESLSLIRVRLGAVGVHELHEAPVILTKAQ